jgi:hypothetical protein
MAHAILPHENDISFGQAYAVLNLDWMTCLIDSIKDTSVGQEFIASCSQWNDAVRQKVPRPLNIFTTLTFSTHSQPELAPDSHFAGLIKDYGTFERGLRAVQIDDNFVTDDEDIILQKTRWYAGSGNSLEQILRAQKIETVVIVCSRTPQVLIILNIILIVRIEPFWSRHEHSVPAI